MGFSSIEAMLCGRPFHDALESVSNLRWQLRVPLGDRGFVQVGRSLEGPEPAELAPFVEMLHTRLLPRLVLVSAVDLSAEHATAQLLHLVRASDAPSVQAQDRDGDRVTR
jgi:hypothetical protein